MKGSFTVEMAVVFPVIFLVLFLFMQFGLYFTYRVYTLNVMNQSLAICSRARQEMKPKEEARQLAERYLQECLRLIPIEMETVQLDVQDGWVQEEYTARVSAQYSFLFDMTWSAVEKSCVMNPVIFRNRLDLVWEKGKQYLSWYQQVS